ncbi:MAG: glycosyl hydrolase family 65 protein [Verrucomicrobiota bacterium]
MSKVATKYLVTDPWKITEKGFHPNRSEVSESIFALGNEYMGIRGFFDEGFSGDSLIGCYFNGIFEEGTMQYPTWFKGMSRRNTFMANSVNWVYTRLSLNGEQLDLAKSKFTDFVREIDLRTGVLVRSFVWHAKGGKKLRLRFERFTSMVEAHLGAQRIVFEPLNFSGSIKVRSGLDFSPVHREAARNVWKSPKRGTSNDIVAIMAETERSGHRVFSSYLLQASQSIRTKLVEEDKFIGQEFSLKLTAGKSATLDKLVVNLAERKVESETLWARGMKLAAKFTSATFDKEHGRHVASWEEVWKTLDVTIEGDPENQQGVRFCIFQLHQTYHGVDPTLNIGAKGLTGEVYEGATFWDSETYCLPFYLFNNPKAARNLLGFRYKTLPQAIERAKQLDCKGARYPMITIDGTETCGVWQHGDLEIHLSAAVAYGIWHYNRVCPDDEFLFTQGIEMLLQISRYYASRGEWGSTSGQFGFFGVMGADEFHMMVNHNVYTNVMAKKTFEWTLEVIDRMKKSAPSLLDKVCRKVKLDADEPREWRRMAGAMRVLQDRKSGIYEQHDGYFELPHIDIKSIPPTDFPLYKHWAYVRIFRYDMLKQPDVLLLPFFFSQEFSDKIKKANYEYYEPRCSHESSLSPGVHSILAAELGRHEEAYDYSLHAARLDLDDYNRNTHEGLHTTSMAAAWMNLVYGFGGLRSDGKTLVLKPSIPKKWKSFSFRLLYRGEVLSIRVEKKSVSLSSTSTTGIDVVVLKKMVRVGIDAVTVPLPADRRA